jgi:hypothetical protein
MSSRHFARALTWAVVLGGLLAAATPARARHKLKEPIAFKAKALAYRVGLARPPSWYGGYQAARTALLAGGDRDSIDAPLERAAGRLRSLSEVIGFVSALGHFRFYSPGEFWGELSWIPITTSGSYSRYGTFLERVGPLAYPHVKTVDDALWLFDVARSYHPRDVFRPSVGLPWEEHEVWQAGRRVSGNARDALKLVEHAFRKNQLSQHYSALFDNARFAFQLARDEGDRGTARRVLRVVDRAVEVEAAGRRRAPLQYKGQYEPERVRAERDDVARLAAF